MYGGTLALGASKLAAAVYPRVYGGTFFCSAPSLLGQGLSPRVRGNPEKNMSDRYTNRSIPACTGEPQKSSQSPGPARVYPRVYGGTPWLGCLHSPGGGLSPRVRGNRHDSTSTKGSIRSIPACTGEPWIPRNRLHHHRVYPRVYGGTPRSSRSISPSAGLSPRVRGNLGPRNVEAVWTGSIPACTGEPDFKKARRSLPRVYPRVYGGTPCWSKGVAMSHGLSPRVRGNRICAFS